MMTKDLQKREIFGGTLLLFIPTVMVGGVLQIVIGLIARCSWVEGLETATFEGAPSHVGDIQS